MGRERGGSMTRAVSTPSNALVLVWMLAEPTGSISLLEILTGTMHMVRTLARLVIKDGRA